jgi:zinc protease
MTGTMQRKARIACVTLLALSLAARAGAQQAQRARDLKRPAATHTEIKYPPLKEIKIPNVETFTLPNGLRVYLLEDHELPTVSGRALIRTGNLFDPPDKIGLAEATGAVMRTGGTVSKTGDQLDQELESMAAEVETGIGETSGEANFFTLKENFDKVLAIYADVLMHPAFRQDKLDLFKNQTRSAIARRNDDAAQIARREFANLVYGKDNPYGWQQEYEHVDRIQRADLEQFYKRYFFPKNVMLAVYGDFSAPEMKTKLAAAFQGWQNQQPPVPPFPPVKPSHNQGVYLAAKDDVNQSNIRMGHLGGQLNDEDYPALDVMADILGGGGFRSRLVQQVRSKLGYAYSVGARWGAAYDHPGLFVAAAGTKSATTVKAARAMMEEIHRIRTSEVSDEELRTAKESVLNSFVFNFDTKAKTLNRLLTYEYYGYPKDFIFQYKKKLEAVTKADVLRAAKTHLHPDRMTIVVVGKPADFDQPLSALLHQPVIPLDITIPQPKQERVKSDPESAARGRAVLERAQKAAGGADRLSSLKDLVWSGSAQISGPMGSMAVKRKLQVVFPSTLRQENELPFGKIAVYTDGKGGWMKAPQGQMPLPAPQLQQARGEMFRLTETLLLSDRVPGRTVAYVKRDKVGGRDADVIAISSEEGDQVQLYIDAASGEVLKKVYSGQAMTGPPAKVEEVYEDFREVNGIRVPFKTVTFQNDQKFAETRLTDLQYNSGLKAEDLAKP